MREIPSCDTLAVHKSLTAASANLFAKNSDRDVDESQPLIWFPAKKYPAGEKLRCTYIEIDQVEETYGMIGSKPWWIWGFEHGVNEHGVAIGNEADWSEVPPNDQEALLGMDLLRLGLERGKTAYEAMHVIIDLLESMARAAAFLRRPWTIPSQHQRSPIPTRPGLSRGAALGRTEGHRRPLYLQRLHHRKSTTKHLRGWWNMPLKRPSRPPPAFQFCWVYGSTAVS